MKITRRNFVLGGFSGLVGLPFIDKEFGCKPARFNSEQACRILVLIHLAGGNDWFSTTVPYSLAEYYQARPNIAIDRDSVLALNSEIGLHPAMPALHSFYQQGQMAVIIGANDESHSFGHHKAIEDWQYSLNADARYKDKLSWQGRYAALLARRDCNLSFPAVNVQPGFLKGQDEDEIVFSSLEQTKEFVFDVDLHYRLNNASRVGKKQKNALAQALKNIVQSIESDRNVHIYNLSLGGFDTHSNQLDKHARLLSILSQGIEEFQAELHKTGLEENVLTLVYTEFGRDINENNELGTEHGGINNALIIGNKIKGGIYKGFDYRSIQASLIEQWLSCPSGSVIGDKPKLIPFV